MRALPIVSLVALACALGSCTGMGTNDKPVYDVLSGTTKLIATVTDPAQTPTSVTFTLDGSTTLPGTVANTNGAFSIDFDTTKTTNGVHTVKAVGQPGSVELLNATIFVQNSGAAAPAAPASTGP